MDSIPCGFLAILGLTILIAFAVLGLGRLVTATDSPAAASVRGWSLVLLVCAPAWFFKFPAERLAPLLRILALAGVWGVFRTVPARKLALGVLGTALIVAVYAFPFLQHSHLLAYASSGTDQWGYAGVSKWLVHHSVDDLPAVTHASEPDWDWVWHVLSTKERPLLYIVLAAIASAARCATITVYVVLPASLTAGLFLAFLWDDEALAFAKTRVKLAIALGVCLQPLVVAHFLHQFLGGAVTALFLMLLMVGALHEQGRRPGNPFYYAFALLLSVFILGLYTITVALFSIGLLGLIWAASGRVRMARGAGEARRPMRRPAKLGLALVLLSAAASFAGERRLTIEPVVSRASGKVGHVWAHLGATYGQMAIVPWYSGDDAPGGLNPVVYDPPGSELRAALLLTLGAFLVLQGARWLWRRKEIALLAIAAGAGFVLWQVSPPQGTHWLLGKTLPIFGPLLPVIAAASIVGERRRWIRIIAAALACLPLVLAAPQLAVELNAPSNLFFIADTGRPMVDEAWHSFAYDYFVQDTRRVDWSTAPYCFHDMTWFMPADIRPEAKR